jgi:regulator of nucleoside diphosphate kinase
MKYGSLILEKKEFVYLKRVLNISGYAGDFETQKSLSKLSEEIKNAHILDEEEMPNDVIRFDSKVTVISDQGWERKLQVVIPMERDVNKNKISVLTPMGAAIFGYSKGDTIVWNFPSGIQHLKIVDVNQENKLKGREVVI